MVAFVIAVRQALHVGTERALFVALLGIGAGLVVLFVLGILFVGRSASGA